MAILAGIDEAGYGPVLGPLVVSAAVLRLPPASVGANLWRLLAGAVTRRSLRTSPALPLADSKRMHVRRDGPVHLERGVLGMLRPSGPPPPSFRQLLRRIAPTAATELGRYPWYADGDLPLPRQADPRDLALRAAAAAEAMATHGIKLESLRAEPVLVGEYNRLIRATKNKATALFGVTSRLIAYAFNTYAGKGDAPACIVVDRQGGRVRYLRHIQRMFAGAAISVIEESDRRSRYFVEDHAHAAQIQFVTDGEDKFLPVALASMASKYIRELFMELLNRYWAQRVKDLKPTAGYYVDGHRFLKDIAAALADERIDSSLLVRSR